VIISLTPAFRHAGDEHSVYILSQAM